MEKMRKPPSGVTRKGEVERSRVVAVVVVVVVEDLGSITCHLMRARLYLLSG